MVGTRGRDAQAASSATKSSSVGDKQSKRNAEDSKPATTDAKDSAAIGQPLGPPPRPSQSNGERSDYFSGHAYQSEPNPFDAQFANPNDTPGKLLPPVAALTSPSSLLPADTPGWNSSLRSGPLSPAMLAGPASTDYFDQGLRGFPTPNESSLRTGLTPGGGGSMFPAASPGTQAIFSLSNINTPGTMDFIRTGMNARAVTNGNGPTSQPTETQTSQSIDLRLPNQSSGAFDTSGHDADAASSLFLLAQNGTRGNSFPVTTQSTSAAMNPTTLAPVESPTQARSKKDSIDSISTPENDASDTEQSEETVKPATRSRGRKAPEGRSNNRRKATDTPAKTPASKRARASAAQDKLDSSPTTDSGSKESKKAMTEDEKRKNFLERNRVAALKCRQRKKQWLQNLQQKVDLYGQENEALTNHVNQLREQIFQLRSLLIQHRECPTLTNHPAMMSILSQDMNGPQFMQASNGPVQQIPMMLQDARHVTNGGPVMPRN